MFFFCGCVVCLQEELIALQPQLEESTRQTEAAMEVIAKETVEADKVKKVCLSKKARAPAGWAGAHFVPAHKCVLSVDAH